jgi:hypothetical protein
MSASRVSLVEQMVEQKPWEADPTYQEGAILFCCKSNVSYDPAELDDSSPDFSFREGDFLQVVKIINSDWWLARVFGGGATLGPIPACVISSNYMLPVLTLAPCPMPAVFFSELAVVFLLPQKYNVLFIFCT